VNRYRAHQRLIVAVLMVLVLVAQFVNALSNSHTRVAHRHASGGHVGKTHSAHDPRLSVTKAKAARTHVHTHQHDPADHTHDLPLRQALAAVQFTAMPTWHTEAAVSFPSAVVHPPERPPKPTAIASFVQSPASCRHLQAICFGVTHVSTSFHRWRAACAGSTLAHAAVRRG
jgi:hypothetical protein